MAPGKLTPRWLLPAAALLATWPLWWRLAEGMAVRGESPTHLLPLVLACGLVWRDARAAPAPLREPGLLLASLLAAVVALQSLGAWLPAAAAGVLLLTAALSHAFLGRRLGVSVAGLGLLSLPAMPYVHSYCSFPLRRLVAGGAALLLEPWSGSTVVNGTNLHAGDVLVAIDAPCSGLAMLWSGAVVVFCLAGWSRFGPLRTLALAIVGLAAVVTANILRAASLVWQQSAIPDWAPRLHMPTGAIMFMLATVAMALSAHWLQRRDPCPAP